jgi:hypothetical protein
MNEAPYFAPYPRARSPVYSRWWLSGAALLSVLIVGGKLFLADLYEPRVMIVGMVGVLLLWLTVFLLRVLYVHFNQHFAHTYTETARQIQRAWWTRHRQQVALVDAVLVGPVCNSVESRMKLFTPDHQPPVAEKVDGGLVMRLRQLTDNGIAGRERKLAMLLAMQWKEQHEAPIDLQPLRCYWQGTASAWAAFVEQMASSCPQVKLPEHPEPWQGLASLDVIIDQLQGAAADARILCAGCASLPPQANSHLPAGEAAVLWLLGTQGGVRFSRGEWFAAESEDLATLAERVLQQSELDKPAPACVSFSQPEITELSALNWNIRPFVQDANFGALGSLEAMVVQTLAAAYAQAHGVPCAWLGNDPHHTLTLGVVKPDDSRT